MEDPANNERSGPARPWRANASPADPARALARSSAPYWVRRVRGFRSGEMGSPSVLPASSYGSGASGGSAGVREDDGGYDAGAPSDDNPETGSAEPGGAESDRAESSRALTPRQIERAMDDAETTRVDYVVSERELRRLLKHVRHLEATATLLSERLARRGPGGVVEASASSHLRDQLAALRETVHDLMR